MTAQAPDELLLVQTLEGLAGRPSRMANLRNLLEHLSADDVRGLAPQIARLDLKSDIVSRLPVELLVLVAEHCSLDDFFVFLHVSRGWREMWTSDPIISAVSATWLPEPKPGRDPSDGPGPSERERFTAALRARYRRSRGLVRSELQHRCRVSGEDYFTLDPARHPDPERAMDEMFGSQAVETGVPNSDPLYMDGKLAWQPGSLEPPHNSVVIVDDLRTRTRACYRVDDLLLRGMTLSLCNLGRELVVARANPRLIYVWNLSSGQLKIVTFPHAVMVCEVEGLSLTALSMGAVGSYGPTTAFVWTFSGPLRELSPPGPSYAALPGYPGSAEPAPAFNPVNGTVIPSPSSPGTIFVVTSWRLSSTPVPNVVGVDEFLRGEYVQSYYHVTPADGHVGTRSERRGHYFQRVGHHGWWGLVWACDDGQSGDGAPRDPETVLLTFNTISRQFRVEKYRLPLLHWEVDTRTDVCGLDLHFWCRQMTIQLREVPGHGAYLDWMPAVTFNDITGPHYGDASRRPPPVRGPPGTKPTASTYFDFLDGILKQLQLPERWTGSCFDFVRLVRGVPGYVSPPVAYYGLAYELPSSDDPAYRVVNGHVRFYGDDDFLIRFDPRSGRYIVWAFDMDLRGRKTEGGAAVRAEDADRPTSA